MRRLTLMSVLCLAALLPGVAAGQERAASAQRLSRSAGTRLPLAEEGALVQVYTRQELLQLPARSLADALRLLRGVDVRRRGPEGMPAALSLAGAGPDGTLLVVDGEVMNDPASGEFSADLDLSLDAVERVEIREGGASAVWGPGALGGVISVMTRGALLGRANAQCETRYGHGSDSLDTGGYRGAMAITPRSGVALDYRRSESSGFAPGTELSNDLLRLSSRVGTGALDATLSTGYGGRSFGSPDGPRSTRTRGARAAGNLSAGAWTLTSALWLRDHHADVGTSFTSSVGGLRVTARRPVLGGQLLAGMELLRESFSGPAVVSDRRDRHAMFGEYQRTFSSERAELGGARLALRYDHDHPAGGGGGEPRSGSPSTSGGRLSPLAAVWAEPLAGLTLRASGGVSYRLPSFLELQANPQLEAEKAAHLEASATFAAGPLLMSGGITRRWGRDTIVLRPAALQPAPVNLARADVTALTGGMELASRRLSGTRLTHLGFGVSYLLGDPAGPDPLRLKWDLVAGAVLPAGLTAFTRLGLLSYSERPGEALLWDVRLGRQLLEGEILEVYAELQNALDETHQERPGVPLPGRTLFAGLNLTW